MPATALALVLTAALLHAGWNLLVKRATERLIFTWWSLVVGALLLAPLSAAGPLPPARVWPYVVASAVAEAAYFFILIHAYASAEFSLVYPLARGAAPALLAVWAALFLGERPSGAGLAGLGLLLAGLVVVAGGGQLVGLLSNRGRQAEGDAGRGVALALGVALCISLYSVVDGAAVRMAAPGPYLALVMAFTAGLATPLALRRYGRRAALAEWRANWPRIVAVGALTQLTYWLVLRAYAIARVGYTGAIREVSIVFAALIGWLWLGERFGAARTAGSLLIVAGILTIAVAG